MRVIGYVRVSTDDQAREGISLDVQRDKVAAFARLHDLELADVVTDAGASAKTLERPGLAKVLDTLDRGDVTGLVVFKLDRLTRHLGDWTALIERYFGDTGGRSLMSVSEAIDTRTAGGRLVLNIMITVAMWERETVVERTRAAVRFKQARGERVSGRIPYGFRLQPDGKTLADDPDEADTLADVRAMRAAGRTLRGIAHELQSRALPTRSGRPWAHSTIDALTRRNGP